MPRKEWNCKSETYDNIAAATTTTAMNHEMTVFTVRKCKFGAKTFQLNI